MLKRLQIIPMCLVQKEVKKKKEVAQPQRFSVKGKEMAKFINYTLKSAVVVVYILSMCFT